MVTRKPSSLSYTMTADALAIFADVNFVSKGHPPLSTTAIHALPLPGAFITSVHAWFAPSCVCACTGAPVTVYCGLVNAKRPKISSSCGFEASVVWLRVTWTSAVAISTVELKSVSVDDVTSHKNMQNCASSINRHRKQALLGITQQQFQTNDYIYTIFRISFKESMVDSDELTSLLNSDNAMEIRKLPWLCCQTRCVPTVQQKHLMRVQQCTSIIQDHLR